MLNKIKTMSSKTIFGITFGILAAGLLYAATVLGPSLSTGGDLQVDGAATTTDLTVLNTLTLSGDNPFVIDSLPFGDANGNSHNLCYDTDTHKFYYLSGGASTCNQSLASPFLLNVSGTVVLSEVLANQWKVEAESVNRIDGYDGSTDPTFILGSFKSKETDYLDSLSLQLRCEKNQVVTTHNYPVTLIGKLNEAVNPNWLSAVNATDGTYFQGREGDKTVVSFEKPQPQDWAGCSSKTFAFVAHGYYEWEKLEFDAARASNFFEEYKKYLPL